MCLEVPVLYDFQAAAQARALAVGFSQHARLVLDENDPSNRRIHSFTNYKFNPRRHTFEFLMLRSDWEALPRQTTSHMVIDFTPPTSSPCNVKEAATIKYTWKLNTTESSPTRSQVASSKVKVSSNLNIFLQ